PRQREPPRREVPRVVAGDLLQGGAVPTLDAPALSLKVLFIPEDLARVIQLEVQRLALASHQRAKRCPIPQEDGPSLHPRMIAPRDLTQPVELRILGGVEERRSRQDPDVGAIPEVDLLVQPVRRLALPDDLPR